MNTIKHYSKEESKKIDELFASGATRDEIEQYAKSIGRTYSEVKQKNYYNRTYNKKKGPKVLRPWKQMDINYLVEHWPRMTTKERIQHAKNLDRSFNAVSKMYSKKSKSNSTVVTKEPITITKVVEQNPTRIAATITIGDVKVELPDTATKVEINGNTLTW